MNSQPISAEPWAGLGPLKHPHFKDAPEAKQYNGSVQGWLDWSVSLRRFLAARDLRRAPLLHAIEGLRGKIVTAQDEET